MNEATAKVIAKAGHVLFEGLVADAEKFIADNFPRVHLNNGVSEPDYTVVTDPPGQTVAVPATHPQPEAEPETVEPVNESPETPDQTVT